MKRESRLFYFIRLFFALILCIFVLMLYWSSLLVEADLKVIRTEINQIKKELDRFEQGSYNPVKKENDTPSAISKADPKLPNLLTEDPFYLKTLPKLLGKDFRPSGTFHGAGLGKPTNLHPFSNWSNVSGWIGLCTPNVSKFEIGKYETFAPDMAVKVEERFNETTKTKEFWVHLRQNVFWQPLKPEWFANQVELSEHFLKKHPVNAHDFKFFYDAMMNPQVYESGAVALRTFYSDVESIEVVDDFTFIVRWRHEEVKLADGTTAFKPKYLSKQLTGNLRPLASFVYKYFPDGKKIVEDDQDPETYRQNSVWAQNFAEHWAKNIIPSCGPWIFDGMTDRQIRFRRNPYFYEPLAVLVEASEVDFKETPEAVWQLFKSNQLDSYEVRPSQLNELQEFLNSPTYLEQAKNASIQQLKYLSRVYSYIGWNQAKPYFQSKKVRQALTMAIDRQRIIRQNLNNLGVEITGPFSPNSPSYNHAILPWPYDPLEAKRLLEEEGWADRDGNGVLSKIINGNKVAFRFKLTYYVKNPTGKAICEYISTALKEIGIDCQLNGVDLTDLSAAFDDKSFDAIALGWSLGAPPEDPKQLWHSSGSKEKGSSNAIGFANAEADKIIDALQFESDHKKRIALYHRFGEIIHEEAPYVFLYAPKTLFLYRSYLQNVFIPAERQDLIPGANMAEPDSSIFWIK